MNDLVESYMEILERKDEEASKEFVKEHFGVEGSDEFKADEYQAFVASVVEKVIDSNRKLAEDEAAADEEAPEEDNEEVVEETEKDEADA